MTKDKKSLLNQFTEGVNKGIKQTSEAAQMVGETVIESAQAVGNTINDGVNSAGTTVERGAQAISDSRSMRRAALLNKVPYYTTLAGSVAAAKGIAAHKAGSLEVRPLQSYFG